MEPIRVIESRTVVLPRENVDTDQIIPARFLKVTDKKGLGKALFSDWRYAADGAPRPDFVMNRPEAQGCSILVAGDNFGCGSSREHAPWALVDAGVRAVISTRIADIFRNNALKNGLVPVVLDAASHAKLLAAPGASVRVDVEAQTVTLPDGSTAQFPLDGFARYCLLNGVDELGFLLAQEADIAAFEGGRR
ncbi:3-isopropylmalate dehydratase, small subunit [Anaeromyxobacter dehalogenans 2CP-1]|uniref:3-isopropylmalate dehydratase small subunit n=1 Tax=Anaeromyxobacter dehalogenans (strain ATCC BAA-258 / DSM 21875 / 2CP-1) TaxID=455488 RepID=LEUD_ANAD2|nr:3-isopropylmalate dehydratase small subunit [Anaeromyxobacter dehalogenans]B8J826.1 RecName: Full=3-isopropylmalate dehydratase small subunit; AltName: Full=Alpha-IPM isomerase; Short=IPMI; AltName: Full=Isopropylmalate isomerase [Anaeromyxobacter dehalogenans 2CP-1]ACL65325.1 3-isopropylmalate dehydratase, small subunit [Anaeromyxobacter dehalogenans 2CP-1]